MKYREQEREKAIKIRNNIFRDPGNGLFLHKEREFVLSEPMLNLWEGIREDALFYFSENKIAWWKGGENEPTGHLLSSQIACVNHLYFLRQRQDIATTVLKSIDPSVANAEIVDDGYVEFEFIGEKQYLKEKGFSRGANCTSIDAVMIGHLINGERKLFLIEWKYTEDYKPESKYIEARSAVYDEHIIGPDSPFMDRNPEGYYYEPFYQMMRQTLLGSLCCINFDHDCSDYIHVHVIPEQNLELRNTITSPAFKGVDISSAWKSVLKSPEKYRTITPESLLQPAQQTNDVKSVLKYLKERYWS